MPEHLLCTCTTSQLQIAVFIGDSFFILLGSAFTAGHLCSHRHTASERCRAGEGPPSVSFTRPNMQHVAKFHLWFFCCKALLKRCSLLVERVFACRHEQRDLARDAHNALRRRRSVAGWPQLLAGGRSCAGSEGCGAGRHQAAWRQAHRLAGEPLIALTVF